MRVQAVLSTVALFVLSNTVWPSWLALCQHLPVSPAYHTRPSHQCGQCPITYQSQCTGCVTLPPALNCKTCSLLSLEDQQYSSCRTDVTLHTIKSRTVPISCICAYHCLPSSAALRFCPTLILQTKWFSILPACTSQLQPLTAAQVCPLHYLMPLYCKPMPKSRLPILPSKPLSPSSDDTSSSSTAFCIMCLWLLHAMLKFNYQQAMLGSPNNNKPMPVAPLLPELPHTLSPPCCLGTSW